MLVKGQWIEAKLIEAVEKNRWIVSFAGELFQVENHTGITFVPGKMLRLQVTRQSPLQLKIVAPNSGPRCKLDLLA